MSDNSQAKSDSAQLFESASVTKATVVSGLGYPNGRVEQSTAPTGWQATTEQITIIEKQVSRETSR